MIIKNKKKLSSYKYLVMFDLASKVTGVCLWDIENHKPVGHKIIRVTGKDELPAWELYHLIDDYFQDLLNKTGLLFGDFLVYKEAMPSQVHGGSSTVQTFIALSRSHAILDFYTREKGIDVYDYTGVYPVSTHAYIKKLMGWDHRHPVDKKDINKYIQDTYNLENISLDESDAIFLAQTFVDNKWNKDIEESIRDVKRRQKALKAAKAIEACEEYKRGLEGLKMP